MTAAHGPIAQALWLALPVTLAGLTHVTAIARGVLPSLARVRLDGGLELGGRPLLGANKTLRGAIVMIGASVVWAGVFDSIQRGLGLDESLRFIPHEQLGSVGLGLLLGTAYIVGELPNSFIKRRLGVAPGAAAAGRGRRLFWVIDQLDSAVAIVLALAWFRAPSLGFVLALLGLTALVHPAVAALMKALELKERIG
ncbi:MAG: CDP-archaeol synthase [Enhygromyxa sp.]